MGVPTQPRRMNIGITERGDAAVSTEWTSWVYSNKPSILITKDPMTLYEMLAAHQELCLFPESLNIIVHCTITGHGGSVLEPGAPKPEHALNGYRKLIELLGATRVILRIDPILIGYAGGVELAQEIFQYRMGTRVRISFLDNYPHVKKRFMLAGLNPLPYDFHADLTERQRVAALFPEAEICGEPGFTCTGCVSETDCQILGVEPDTAPAGQRTACRCLANKIELLNNRHLCPHGCLYCYWKDPS